MSPLMFVVICLCSTISQSIEIPQINKLIVKSPNLLWQREQRILTLLNQVIVNRQVDLSAPCERSLRTFTTAALNQNVTWPIQSMYHFIWGATNRDLV